MAASAIADHCGIPLLATSYAQWQAAGEGHLGDVIRTMREVFAQARKAAPVIIFIDELDAVGSRQVSSRHPEWWRAIVNALLEELDGTAERDGVVVIGATNSASQIDPALRRAGRLDREFQIGLPDMVALTGIIQSYLGADLTSDEINRLANLAVGRSGADVASWARGARRKARLAKQKKISFDDVLSEITGNVPDTSDPLWRRIATHEAGHAVIYMTQHPGESPTIMLSNTGAPAGRTFYHDDERAVITDGKINNLILVSLGGRAAEEVVFGHASSGAGGSWGSGLARATNLVLLSEVNLGLGSSGLLWADVPGPQDIANLLATRPGLHDVVQRRLFEALDMSKRLIRFNRCAVELIADALLNRLVLTPQEVRDLMEIALVEKKFKSLSAGSVMIH